MPWLDYSEMQGLSIYVARVFPSLCLCAHHMWVLSVYSPQYTAYELYTAQLVVGLGFLLQFWFMLNLFSSWTGQCYLSVSFWLWCINLFCYGVILLFYLPVKIFMFGVAKHGVFIYRYCSFRLGAIDPDVCSMLCIPRQRKLKMKCSSSEHMLPAMGGISTQQLLLWD